MACDAGSSLSDRYGMALRKKWVLPGTFVNHGHCAPWSASSYEILNLIDTLHLSLFVARLLNVRGGKVWREIGGDFD
jgi:hypothetical protein